MHKSDPLIRTKLRLPSTRPELVPRPRLQEQILQGLRGPLTLVTAPAGFGKTTLVAACLAGSEAPAAWLSLDQHDNEPERFLRYLAAALQGVEPSIGREAVQRLSAAQPVSPEAILTSLINDLDARIGGVGAPGMILALDDYQFISNQAVHEAAGFLLEHCPHGLHLVIATRSDPPLPLSRLRARGHIVELRAADLRFTESEAARFLNEVMGLRLDAESIALLEERTEGWIAGLQMAALSMRDRADVMRFIQGFSGTNRYILDYLLEEVLASQPPEVQRFLLYTSILERVTAPLCEAILAEEGGSPSPGQAEALLAYLERGNLFLVPLDDERSWYRYHHLFADLLRSQLVRSVGEQGAARLHNRAADWFERHGATQDAIHHASLASDDERIERLIGQNYIEIMNRGETSWVRYWMGKLSKEFIYQRPWLCLYEAFSRSWFGQVDEANTLLEQAACLLQCAAPSPDTRAMQGYYDYVKSRVTAMQGDTRRAIELCLAARENTPADNLGLQIEISITLGYEYFLCGDFLNARETFEEMIRTSAAAGAINNPVAAYCLLARMQVLQGCLHEAEAILQKAIRLLDETEGQSLGVNGLVEAERAALLVERNEIEAAQEPLKQALEAIPLWGKTDDLVLATLTSARAQLAQGDPAGAENTLEKAGQWVETRGIFSEARGLFEPARVKLWLARGERAAAWRWAEARVRSFAAPDPLRYEDEPAHLALARVSIDRGEPGAAMGLLASVEEAARSGGRQGRLVEILLLKALALQAAGEAEQAQRSLSESLALAAPEGFMRVFLDEGRPAEKLLARWAACAGQGPVPDYARQLLSAFAAEPRVLTAEVGDFPYPGGPNGARLRPAWEGPHARPGAAAGLVDPLSQRELEVLHLLATGSTNQQIADRLVVSRGTVKAHTASIYRKLDTANRTEAVARARQLGLLP